MSEKFSCPKKSNVSRAHKIKLDESIQISKDNKRKKEEEGYSQDDSNNNDEGYFQQQIESPIQTNRITKWDGSDDLVNLSESSDSSSDFSEESDSEDESSVEGIEQKEYIAFSNPNLSDCSDSDYEDNEYSDNIKFFNRMDCTGKSFVIKVADSNKRLMSSCLRSMDKLEFSVAYVQFEAFNGFTKLQTANLFTFLNKALPSIDWPVHFKENGPGKGKVTPALTDYTGKDIRTFEVHMCMNGCMAFIDKFAKHIFCVECHHPRFLRCTKHHCIYPKCNPYKGGHSIACRIAWRTGYYRPIIPLLKELYQWSLDEPESIYYVDNKKPDFSTSRYEAGLDLLPDESDDVRLNESTRVEDIMDSKQSCHHLNEMHQLFERMKQKPGNEDILEASFILGEFYDGGTLFKRKAKSIWPLVMSILNCNPSIRVQPGIGMFLVALHDLVLGSNAEQSLFKNLFIPELNFLYDGTIFSFPDSTGKVIRVFLQARLVVHVLDTIALLDVFKLKGIFCIIFLNLCHVYTYISQV
jgi:hypothetical protein